MNQAVKTLVAFTIAVSLTTISTAQLRIPGTNNVAPDIKKVIQDYPNHFQNLQGELIIQNPQSSDYQCNFKVSGAEEATITRFVSKKNISSWQAVMLTTESFEEARKKFKSLFSQLNNLTVKMESTDAFHLKGVYESPVEEKKFTSALLSFANADDAMKKLKVEIVMQYELMEWKVKVLVYDREREDNERGSVVE
jgi:hypothetical protein